MRRDSIGFGGLLSILLFAAACNTGDPADDSVGDEVGVATGASTGSGSGSGDGPFTCYPNDHTALDGTPNMCPTGHYCGQQVTDGLSCPKRDICGNYTQNGLHCYALRRRVGGDYLNAFTRHFATGCIGSYPDVKTPTPYNTPGLVIEDSWAESGATNDAWSASLVDHEFDGDYLGATNHILVESDLGCKTTYSASRVARDVANTWATSHCAVPAISPGILACWDPDFSHPWLAFTGRFTGGGSYPSSDTYNFANTWGCFTAPADCYCGPWSTHARAAMVTAN